jgi:heme-degrading monooxygenase HmoA
MAIVSVTRLRIRSVFDLPAFIRQALKSARQAEAADGFLGGRLMREARNAFWTVTVWKDLDSMEAFRIAGAHARIMHKLMEWCDEASVVHWEQEGAAVPSWEEAHRRMVKQGRASKVIHPSAGHMAHRIPAPRPGMFEGPIRPRREAASGVKK